MLVKLIEYKHEKENRIEALRNLRNITGLSLRDGLNLIDKRIFDLEDNFAKQLCTKYFIVD